jgi:hypothetical protein
MEEVHMSVIEKELIASILGILLCLIAFFLIRILNQFDKLTEKVAELNQTFMKSDREVGEVVVLLKAKVEELDTHVWDRLRAVEEELITLKAGGCNKC